MSRRPGPFTVALGTALIGLLPGCVSDSSPPNGVARERGPDGTVAYQVQIEASHPDVKIEANGEYLGSAPLVHTVFGDKDGTFHNFGSFDYVIRALPSGPGQYLQTKIFRTGGFFTQEDRIPKRIFFDMKQPPGIQLAPSPVPPPPTSGTNNP